MNGVCVAICETARLHRQTARVSLKAYLIFKATEYCGPYRVPQPYNAEKDEGVGPADAIHARKKQAAMKQSEWMRVWFCLFLVLFHFKLVLAPSLRILKLIRACRLCLLVSVPLIYFSLVSIWIPVGQNDRGHQWFDFCNFHGSEQWRQIQWRKEFKTRNQSPLLPLPMKQVTFSKWESLFSISPKEHQGNLFRLFPRRSENFS